jgi:hypothetical protein
MASDNIGSTVMEIGEAALLIGLVWFLYTDVISPIKQAENTAAKALGSDVWKALIPAAGAYTIAKAIQIVRKKNSEGQGPTPPPPAVVNTETSWFQNLVKSGRAWTSAEVNRLVQDIQSGSIELGVVLAALASLGLTLQKIQTLAPAIG